MDVLLFMRRRCTDHVMIATLTAALVSLGVSSTFAEDTALADDTAPADDTALSGQSQAAAPSDTQELDSGDSEPYIVFVADQQAFTRCGPGDDYYRTDPLRRGQELEVYVETGDGWLGIRPPENSFCWMPAEHIEMASDQKTGTVREDDTVAWIGTNLGQARRYRWQVQLPAGETVVILGSNDRDGASGNKSWLRIVPPSGEFRWVHRDQIAESAEQLAKQIASEAEAVKVAAEPNSAGNVATVAMEEEADQTQQAETLVPVSSRRTAKSESTDEEATGKSALQSLQAAEGIPELRPAPAQAAAPSRSASPMGQGVPDRPFQFHRGADSEDYVDRGAVIGSGLREEWREQSGSVVQTQGLEDTGLVDDGTQSILRDEPLDEPAPQSGAAAAAEAIAAPLRKVTDVVANFISPPRLVEIDSSTSNFLDNRSAADRRWQVGSGRPVSSSVAAPGQLAPGLGNPIPTIQGMTTQGTLPHNANPQSARDALTATELYASPGTQAGIMQTAALAGQPAGQMRVGRVVSVAQITRVQDAVSRADIETIGQVLSQLMAEAASADELDPLIRRVESLLRSGDVNNATRSRELLDRAQRYRNVAARRDGVTRIESTSLASQIAPLPGMSGAPGTGSATAGAMQAAHVAAADGAGLSRTTPAQQMQSVPTSSATIGIQAGQVPPRSIETPLGPVKGTATGFLVQVYSSRANSPPFALTDDAGLTIAYVTPYPGVNLRNHLNSRVSVSGNEKLLEGMNTPHILVDRAIRR